jgi:uncharacterized membrane protein YjjB (DUF3815 family)
MEYIIQIVISFMATMCFGVIFNAPIKILPWCGVAGSIGWMTHHTLSHNGIDAVQSSFLAAFFVSVVAHFLARKFKMPMIIFSVCGIISLVPGGTAYNSMRSIIELNYMAGLEYAMRAFMISGAVAMGLVFAEVIVQLVLRSMRKGRTSIESFIKIKKPRRIK